MFQAELVAILLAVPHILRENRSLRPRFVKIFSDSQATLSAQVARRSSSRTVRDAAAALNKIARICAAVRLVWIPSHTGIPGNERADSLAKLGTAIDAPDSPYLCLRPLTSSRGKIALAIMDSWSRSWAEYHGGRMTNDFLPLPNPGRVRPLLGLD